MWMWGNVGRKVKPVDWAQCAMAEHQFLLLSLCASALVLRGSGSVSAASATAASPSVSPSRSKYIPKWKKQACEAPASLNSQSHYECDDNGVLQCLPGWTGDLCDVPICRKGCDPLQGYCKRPGECRCKLGFYGELCNKCIALPGCQHGYCNNSFECICHEGWDGLFCSEPICRLDCHATRGYCEWPGECRCRLGWSGETCKECQVLPGCLHGTCSKPLECKCEKGWTGILCQTPICADGCHKERGYCRRPGECRCKVGWWGEDCDQCYRYPGCVHGACQRPWECNCDLGYGGMLCDQQLNFCEENENLCENNGTCVSLAEEDGSYRCLCTDNFTGRNCEVNKTQQVIGMRPPPPPSPAPTSEPTDSTTTTEKEPSTKRPTSTNTTETTESTPTSTTTTTTTDRDLDDPDFGTYETTSPKPSTTTQQPALRRTSPGRTTELRRTAPTKQKHRKDGTGNEPNRKSSRAGNFYGLNEIPQRRISVERSAPGSRVNVELLSDGSMEVQKNQEELEGDTQRKLPGQFFELVGSPVLRDITPKEGGNVGESTDSNGRPRIRRDIKDISRETILTPRDTESTSADINRDKSQKQRNEDARQLTDITQDPDINQDSKKISVGEEIGSSRSDKAIDSHPFIKTTDSKEPATVIEYESDGVIEIRPIKGSDKWHRNQQKPLVGEQPLVHQTNELLSRNQNQANIQLNLSNQSQVSGITYHDRRQSYNIQNMIGQPLGSQDAWNRPVINIFMYPNTDKCPCKNEPISCNCTNSLSSTTVAPTSLTTSEPVKTHQTPGVPGDMAFARNPFSNFLQSLFVGNESSRSTRPPKENRARSRGGNRNVNGQTNEPHAPVDSKTKKSDKKGESLKAVPLDGMDWPAEQEKTDQTKQMDESYKSKPLSASMVVD